MVVMKVPIAFGADRNLCLCIDCLKLKTDTLKSYFAHNAGVQCTCTYMER